MSNLNVKAYLFRNVSKNRTCHQTLSLQLMSTIWTNITPPYQLTVWLLKSCIYISEALSISLWRIYQQSFMEINHRKWSNSCEAANQKASHGQVWEISTITTQSADLHTVGAQSTLCLFIHCSVAHQELLWFTSSVSCNTSKPWIKWRLLCTEFACAWPTNPGTSAIVCYKWSNTVKENTTFFLHIAPFSKWLLRCWDIAFHMTWNWAEAAHPSP